MPERPGPPDNADKAGGGDGGGDGYQVPTQFPAPPDIARGGRRAGPPVMPPDEAATARRGPPIEPPEDRAASLWGSPSEAPPEPERWGAAPVHRYGSTALLDRPTARRPVVAPPVRPLPPPPSQQAWDWERSHGLRNGLIAAAAILLVGSLIAALIVFRGRDDASKQSFVEPPPATVTIQPIAPSEGTVASTAPVSLVPVTPPTTAAPAAATAATTTPPAPATTRATTATTRRPVTPTVTASPPYPGCPPCPTTTTRRTTTTTSATTTTTRPQPTG